MTKKEFDKRYLEQKVIVRFKSIFLEPTQTWIGEDDIFVGTLAKDKDGYYYLEEFLEPKEFSVLQETVFRKSHFASVRLVKEFI